MNHDLSLPNSVDISEALRASELSYRRLFEAAQDGILILEAATGRVIDVNPFLIKLLGFSHADMVGRTVGDLSPFRDLVSNQKMLEKLQKVGYVRYENLPLETWDGRKIAVEFVCNVYQAGVDQVIQCNIRDITERKRAEDYRDISREVVQLLNEPGNLRESVQRVLSTVKARTGFDAVGIRLQDGEDFPYFVQEGFSSEFMHTENTLIALDPKGDVNRGLGGEVCLECTCGLVISGTTDPAHALFTPGGSAWTNDSFPILDLPPDEDPRLHARNVCINHGYASIALVPIRSQARIVGLIQFNDRRKGCFTLETVELLEGLATHIGSALMRKQIEAERQNIQVQLQQSQKMESLGILAGGVAHDMNNVLGAILGLASAHIGSLPYGSPLHQALDTICKATERGGKMVKSLLSFARQSPAESHTLDMNTILREQGAFLARTTLEKVRLHMDLEPELRPILGDASALTHAFMNLCVNAVDAMPVNGTLTLHTHNVDNDWIEVVVEDNGMGMPKEVLEKALDPFFTTKGTGKGTGLGLSMVYGTVKAHRGQMVIESQPDMGTRIILRFPACGAEAQSSPRLPFGLPPGDPSPAREGSGTGSHPTPPVLEVARHTPRSLNVLLVDDDELIRSAVQAILEVLGHTKVSTAPSGEEALAMLEGGLEPDLILLDMNMPGLGGIGTLPRLRRLCPAVPIVLATGRADQTVLDLASTQRGVTLLSKPFGLRELQKHIESLGLG